MGVAIMISDQYIWSSIQLGQLKNFFSILCYRPLKSYSTDELHPTICRIYSDDINRDLDNIDVTYVIEWTDDTSWYWVVKEAVSQKYGVITGLSLLYCTSVRLWNKEHKRARFQIIMLNVIWGSTTQQFSRLHKTSTSQNYFLPPLKLDNYERTPRKYCMHLYQDCAGNILVCSRKKQNNNDKG